MAQTELNFGNNTVDANHDATCDNFIEQYMDHICTACAYCGNINHDLDSTEAFCLMCSEFHRTKQPVIRGYTKVSQESNANNAIKNMQVNKKSHTKIASEHVDKKRKIPQENNSVKM